LCHRDAAAAKRSPGWGGWSPPQPPPPLRFSRYAYWPRGSLDAMLLLLLSGALGGGGLRRMLYSKQR
jgi:hypothetical protein